MRIILACLMLLVTTSVYADVDQAKTVFAEQSRSVFAKQLERRMLSAGMSVDVTADGPKKPLTLVLFGFWDKASVYQIISADVLKEAYAAGWKQVDFFGRNSGHWVFDLTNGVPQCDMNKRLCL